MLIFFVYKSLREMARAEISKHRLKSGLRYNFHENLYLDGFDIFTHEN